MSSANAPQRSFAQETERSDNKQHVATSYSRHIAVPRPPYGKKKSIDKLKGQTTYGQQNNDSNDCHMNVMLQRWVQEDPTDGPYHNIASVACNSSDSTSAKNQSGDRE